MKKKLSLLFALLSGFTQSQNVADFDSFSLPADSFYFSASSADFQTSNAVFEYEWTSSFGGFWSKGFAYTNKNNVDSGNYRHLYNCIAGKGYNNSNYYTTAQANGIIKLKTSTDNTVNGFYITNTTYDYKSMKNGDAFAKKFGGTTGNDPDWFKVTAKGFLGGSMKSDSAVFYLADYRFSNNSLDYIVTSWQWFNCSNLGVVDSIRFFMYSSDAGTWGMNTPAFFSMDNFTTSMGVGITELDFVSHVQLFPNPASNSINLKFNTEKAFTGSLKLYSIMGELIKQNTILCEAGVNQEKLDLSELNSGLYFIELNSGSKKQTFKLIKN